MDKETKILRAIMNTFGGLTGLNSAITNDFDTIIENILFDINDSEITYGDVEDYVKKV